MHKPSSPSCEIDVQPFDDALREAAQGSGGYDASHWLYVPNRYGEYRYILGTRGKNPLICCGINPSTAAPADLDNTLKSVERIALGNGFDSFLMFNVYAQRATAPDDMDQELNPLLHEQNMRAFRYLLSIAGDTPAVWAAWGAIVEKRVYLASCIDEMAEISREYGAQFKSAGAISKKGHPHHPLYLKKDSSLDDFDIENYIALLRSIPLFKKNQNKKSVVLV